jgi:hypothetical protein
MLASSLSHGYSMGRWLLWRQRLQGLCRHADAVIALEAKKEFMSMISCGRDLDYEVPGETRFVEKIMEKMTDALKASGRPSLDFGMGDIDVDWVK